MSLDRGGFSPRPSVWSISWISAASEFLMIEPGESDTPPTQINVVFNWLQEVNRRVAGHSGGNDGN